MPDSSSKPAFTADTVLLIGNGIMRVPCKIDENPNASPSWAEYMEQLWQLVNDPEGDAVKRMSQNAFEKLSAPRQAQWFDENFADPKLKREKHDAVALRMHMLAEQLHPTPGFLTNKLLNVVGKLVAKSADILSSRPGNESGASCVNVLTTNLDSALEQNIAHAIENWCLENKLDISAEIEVMAGFRQSAVWRRWGVEKPIFRIRLWKLHGCLRDLRSNTDTDDRNRLMTIYQNIFPEKPKTGKFCAAVPDKQLTPSLGERWKLAGGSKGKEGEVTTIFSQTEYFNNLKLVAQMSHGSADKLTLDSQLTHFKALRELLESRPLLITGYSLTEGDVDIVFLLQTISGPPAKRHAMLEQTIEATPDQVARLKMMGIDTWTYEVPSVGFIPPPGRLKQTAQFEWRLKPYDQPWRDSLQTFSAHSWLIPQLEHLGGLYDSLSSSMPPPDRLATVTRTNRLAVAGLGSIWHAFSLRETNDFPNRRRVSSALNSVDAQVPGGSGLVPIMQAAAMAGPTSAGSMAFFSNVPEGWKSWPEIKEFCLSAGVDVYPFSTLDEKKMDRQTGRNSYVLLFDHEEHDDRTLQPRQRFIMDVNSVVKESLANKRGTSMADGSGPPEDQDESPEQPKACLPEKFQPTEDDLLFADKETDAKALEAWLGPKIFETGASGDELATDAFNKLRPQIWTSGVGSLLRTAVRIEKCFPVDPSGKDTFPKEISGVLQLLDAKPKIAKLIACTTRRTGETGIDKERTERLRRRYPAKLVSFKKDPWNEGDCRPEAPGQKDGVSAESSESKYKLEEGFRYSDEVDYGKWLLENWWWAGTLFLDIVLDSEKHENVLLGCPHKRLGRAIITTIHEGGLMAAWEFADGRRQLIRVEIDKDSAELLKDVQIQTVVNKFEFICETRDLAQDGTCSDKEPLKAVLEIESRQMGVDKKQSPLLEHKLTLRCSGTAPSHEFVEPLGPQNRWNTLAAGDTVRGALAFGLWAYAYGRDPAMVPRDIPDILFASAILATVKCYAGSFVDFLQLLQKLRTHPIWPILWGATFVPSS